MSRQNRIRYIALSLVLLLAAASAISLSQSDSPVASQPGGGAEMVLICGGTFQMGAEGDGDYAPAHRVQVDTFYMDRCEVTNAQYLAFCEQTDHRLPIFWGMKEFRCGPDFPDHPVVGVGWRDAEAYAEWCGKRLPTEAEWEYAARGGLAGLNYSNGDDIDSTWANFKSAGTLPVGSLVPNGFGLHDVTGNVVEWTLDYYDDEYYSAGPLANPQGPEDGRFKVIRGGGWHSGAYCNRVYYRNALPPQWLDFNVGFRCARDYP